MTNDRGTSMTPQRKSEEGQLPRVTIAFWNLGRRDRHELIERLAVAETADVIVLAESGVEPAAMLKDLRKHVDGEFELPESDTPRLQLFTRGTTWDLREVYGDVSGRMTIRVLRFQQNEFLFAAVHLPDKRNFDAANRAINAHELAQSLRNSEDHRGHRRTVLVGDLNMNPFEDGVVSAAGFHAVTTKAIAQDGGRIVQGREYPFFYNPMWGFFGDRTPGPPGTFYYRDKFVSLEWHMLDQVLIRPDVLPWFRDDVKIMTKIGDTDLERPNGRPDNQVGSDHFPIVFRLSACE